MATDTGLRIGAGIRVCTLSEAKSLKPTPVTNGKDAIVKLHTRCEQRNNWCRDDRQGQAANRPLL